MENETIWDRGRGALGILQPLIGRWSANADSPMGPVTCTREFEPVLGGNYVRLTARWAFVNSAYEEIALIGIGADEQLAFWSFTSDGKRSHGTIADGTDVHPEAIAFEADMPAGRARMIYWPVETGDGFRWAAESKEAEGWSRFVEHVYRTA